MAVFALTIEFQARAYGRRATVAQIALPVVAMGLMEPFWQQTFQCLSEQFLASVAKERFSPAIDQDNTSSLIYDDQSIRHRLYQGTKHSLNEPGMPLAGSPLPDCCKRSSVAEKLNH
jgi:hypothetical protein